MACRGVHFALTPQEETKLVGALDSDDEHLMAFIEEIEGRWDREWLQETDKSWDAIHRCLTDGKLEYGPTTLHKCVLGSDNLHDGEDYIVNFLKPEEVKEVAASIKDIDREWMRRKYNSIDTSDYDGELSDEDFEYTWSYFEDLRAFFQKSAEHGRSVLFTVDQ
jgi:hypothetical protein